MEKKRLLLITQEMNPYTVLSTISNIAQQIPPYMHDHGMELRILMPRFGVINERRHRLHEVVRLSGMNIVVNDEDYPLIIKVASMPGSRLQVYFLDNDEYFKRKFVFEDADGQPYEDNMERMIFFCKGAIETVKKFGWPPDIIHCHGWMTGMFPFFLRTVYKDEPLFRNSRITWSAYDHQADGQFSHADLEKALVPPMEKEVLTPFFQGDRVSIDQGVMHYADAVIRCDAELPADMEGIIGAAGKPALDFVPEETMMPAYQEFYDSLLEQEV